MTQIAKRKLVALTCAAMTQHGIVLLLIGPILPSVMKAFRIQESAAGMMLGLGSLGFMLGPIVAGTIADRAGAKWILLFGLIGEVVLLSLFGFAPAFLWAVVINMLLHFAAAFVETAVNVIPTLVERRHTGSLMNLVHLFFGVGALASPFLAGLILKFTDNWRLVLWSAALPTLALALATWRLRFPSHREHMEREGRSSQITFPALLRNRAVLLGALALGLYVGAEVGLSNWIVLYLQRRLGLATLASTSGLSVLWIGIMAGRYLNSLLARSRSSRELVLWAGVGGLVSGLGLLTARSLWEAYVWLGIIGLFMSGVYPNIMADLNGRDPSRTGAVTGILTVGAAAGAMVSQPLLGVIAEWMGLSVAMAMPAVLMGLLTVAYLSAADVKPEARDAGAFSS
ncbi:MAG TPA: MFS transporter [Caldilineae bacterium]|nr:MFS transporter [Caldilineae bacterium]